MKTAHDAVVIISSGLVFLWLLGTVRIIVGDQCGLLAALIVAIIVPITWGMVRELKRGA